ncbi:hypothetical protein FEV09_21755, partial [Pseudanabaena catenata USMAC16]
LISPFQFRATLKYLGQRFPESLTYFLPIEYPRLLSLSSPNSQLAKFLSHQFIIFLPCFCLIFTTLTPSAPFI